MVIVDIDARRVTYPKSVRLEEFPKRNLMDLKIKLSEINFDIVATKKLIR
jgi:hypothetical protein